MGKLREECGVFGIYGKENQEVAATSYYGLFALQHRGQESCGIAVCRGTWQWVMCAMGPPALQTGIMPSPLW